MRIIIAVAILAACSSRAPEATTTTAVASPAPALPAEPTPPLPPAESLYDVALPMQDASGAAIDLDVGRGHPTVISMFYGSCAVACPALIGYLKNIAADAGDDVRVVLVTFDPARDTAARLRELVVSHGLDSRWTLARPTATDARTLAALLGIKYRATAAGEFIHNSVIVALDRDGRPVARVQGLGEAGQLVAALR